MKKAISYVMAIAMLFMLFPVQIAGASKAPTISVGTAVAEVAEGDVTYAYLPINITNNPGVAGIDMSVTIPEGWEIDCFDYVDETGEKGSVFTKEGHRGFDLDATVGHNESIGKFIIASDNTKTADGVLGWIVFAVPETAQGTHEIKIESCTKICDAEDTTKDKTGMFDFVAGSLTIKKPAASATVTIGSGTITEEGTQLSVPVTISFADDSVAVDTVALCFMFDERALTLKEFDLGTRKEPYILNGGTVSSESKRIAWTTVAEEEFISNSSIAEYYETDILFNLVFAIKENCARDSYIVTCDVIDGDRENFALSGTPVDFSLVPGYITVTDTYAVEYYQQKIDGSGYVLIEQELLEAPAGTAVNAQAKEFDGFTENTAKGVPAGTVTADDSLVLSRYYDRNSYTITFHSNGGSDVAPITALYGAGVSAPEAPMCEDYDFAGWFADEALTKPFTFDTMPLNGAELYAKWMEKPPVPYTVRYYHQLTNGSGYAVAEEIQLEAKRNTTVTAPEKTFEGLTLNTKLGDCSGVVTADGGLILSRYYERNEYSIVFDTKGGSVVPAITARYDAVVSEPSAPRHENYKFGGWYADEALKEPYVFGTMPLDGTTVYAKWVDKSTGREQDEYQINGISFRDMNTYELMDTIPTGDFWAEVNVTNLSSTQMDVVWIAAYNKYNQLLDVECLYANPGIGDTMIFAGSIENRSGNVAKVQAMVLSGVGALPLAQAVSR